MPGVPVWVCRMSAPGFAFNMMLGCWQQPEAAGVPEDAKAALVKPDGLVHLIPGIDGLVAFGTDILLLCNSDGVCEDKPVVLVVLDGRHGRAQGVGVVRSERAAQNSAVSIPRLES